MSITRKLKFVLLTYYFVISISINLLTASSEAEAAGGPLPPPPPPIDGLKDFKSPGNQSGHNSNGDQSQHNNKSHTTTSNTKPPPKKPLKVSIPNGEFGKRYAKLINPNTNPLYLQIEFPNNITFLIREELTLKNLTADADKILALFSKKDKVILREAKEKYKELIQDPYIAQFTNKNQQAGGFLDNKLFEESQEEATLRLLSLEQLEEQKKQKILSKQGDILGQLKFINENSEVLGKYGKTISADISNQLSQALPGILSKQGDILEQLKFINENSEILGKYGETASANISNQLSQALPGILSKQGNELEQLKFINENSEILGNNSKAILKDILKKLPKKLDEISSKQLVGFILDENHINTNLQGFTFSKKEVRKLIDSLNNKILEKIFLQDDGTITEQDLTKISQKYKETDLIKNLTQTMVYIESNKKALNKTLENTTQKQRKLFINVLTSDSSRIRKVFIEKIERERKQLENQKLKGDTLLDGLKKALERKQCSTETSTNPETIDEKIERIKREEASSRTTNPPEKLNIAIAEVLCSVIQPMNNLDSPNDNRNAQNNTDEEEDWEDNDNNDVDKTTRAHEELKRAVQTAIDKSKELRDRLRDGTVKAVITTQYVQELQILSERLREDVVTKQRKQLVKDYVDEMVTNAKNAVEKIEATLEDLKKQEKNKPDNAESTLLISKEILEAQERFTKAKEKLNSIKLKHTIKHTIAQRRQANSSEEDSDDDLDNNFDEKVTKQKEKQKEELENAQEEVKQAKKNLEDAKAEDAERKQREAERQRQEEQKRQEQERQRLVDEAKRNQDEAERQRLADEPNEEQKRKQEEAKRKADEAEAECLGDIASMFKNAEDEAEQKEEANRQHQEEQNHQEQERQRQEEQKRQEQERQRLVDEAKRNQDEAERQRLADEPNEEQKRKQEEAKRKAAEDEVKRKADEAEAECLGDIASMFKNAEDEAEQKEEANRQHQEEQNRQEQERQRQEEQKRQEQERQRLVDEAKRNQDEAERQRLADEPNEEQKRKQEEAKRKAAEDEAEQKEEANRKQEETEEEEFKNDMPLESEDEAIDTSLKTEEIAEQDKAVQRQQVSDETSRKVAILVKATSTLHKHVHPSILTNRLNVAAIGAGDEEANINRGLWISGLYGINKQGAWKKIPKYQGRTTGVTIGLDAEFINSHDVIGVAYSRLESQVKYNKKLGKTAVNSHLLSIYGLKELIKGFYLQAITSYGHNYIKNKSISTSNIIGKYQNNNLNFESLLNYKYRTKYDLHLIPNLGFKYDYSRASNYKEYNVDIENLMIQKKSNRSFESSLGGKIVFKPITTISNIVLTPSLYGNIEHHFNNKNTKVNAKVTFKGQTLQETIILPKQPKLGYNIGSNILMSRKNINVLIEYNYHTHRKYQSHQGLVKLKINL